MFRAQKVRSRNKAYYWVVYDRSSGLPIMHGDSLSELSVRLGYEKARLSHAYWDQQNRTVKRSRTGVLKDYIIERVEL